MSKVILVLLLVLSQTLNAQVSGGLFIDEGFPVKNLNVELIKNNKSLAFDKSDKFGQFKLITNKNVELVDLKITNWQLTYIIKDIILTNLRIELGEIFLPLLSDIRQKEYSALTPELKNKYKCTADYSGYHCYSWEILDEEFLKLTCDSKIKFDYDFNEKTQTVIINWAELQCE